MTSTSSNRPGAIIPANIGALRSLTVTMTVMCYLACLAIGALILIDRAVSSWTSGLSREVTVQVRQTKDADVEAEVAKAQEILRTFRASRPSPCSTARPAPSCSNPGSAAAISRIFRSRA